MTVVLHVNSYWLSREQYTFAGHSSVALYSAVLSPREFNFYLLLFCRHYIIILVRNERGETLETPIELIYTRIIHLY